MNDKERALAVIANIKTLTDSADMFIRAGQWNHAYDRAVQISQNVGDLGLLIGLSHPECITKP